MAYADLHMHTTVSDGKTEPENIVDVAKSANLNAIALTDHDRLNPLIEEPLETIDSIDVINGIELRVQPESLDERIDLLGYGVEKTTELSSMTESIEENRINRSNEIIELIEDETGVRLDFEPSGNTGRPHIAEAINQNPDIQYGYNGAFNNLIGRDCPCYVSRDIPTLEEGLSVLKDSTHFISLAHPFRYDDPETALEFSEELDGLECIYPYVLNGFDKPQDNKLVYKTKDEYNLQVTGGSDAHESTSVGTAGIDKQQYISFLEESNLKQYSKI